MKNRVSKCKCGNDEFCSLPNKYDIYKIIDNKLQLVDSPFTDEDIRLFCRECGNELIDAVDFIEDESIILI